MLELLIFSMESAIGLELAATPPILAPYTAPWMIYDISIRRRVRNISIENSFSILSEFLRRGISTGLAVSLQFHNYLQHLYINVTAHNQIRVHGY